MAKHVLFLYSYLSTKCVSEAQENHLKTRDCLFGKIISFLSFQNKNFRKLLYSVFLFFFLFFSKVKKIKYLPHLWSNHRNFLSESSNGKSLQILIQPSGEPREQHLGDPKSSSYTKFHRRQNDRKGRYIIANFWKNYKKS